MKISPSMRSIFCAFGCWFFNLLSFDWYAVIFSFPLYFMIIFNLFVPPTSSITNLLVYILAVAYFSKIFTFYLYVHLPPLSNKEIQDVKKTSIEFILKIFCHTLRFFISFKTSFRKSIRLIFIIFWLHHISKAAILYISYRPHSSNIKRFTLYKY